MRSYWKYRRRAMPCTWTNARIYWQDMVYEPGKSSLSRHTGAGLPWYQRLEGTPPPIKGLHGLIQVESLSLTISNFLWILSCAIGL